MKDLKHTPGNWKVDDSEEYIIRVISPWSSEVTTDNFETFADYRGAHICEMHWNTGVPNKGQALRNAKLIAAAPDLLKALIELLPLAEDGYNLHNSNGCHEEFLKEDRTAMFNAREAIKKATS